MDIPDIKRKREIPAGYKFLFLVICIIGMFIHSCWNKKTVENYVIDSQTIMFEEINKQSVTISFIITNNSGDSGREKVKFTIKDEENNIITSSLSYLDFKKGRNIFKKNIKFKRRIPDINTKKLSAKIEIKPRKVFW